MVTSTSPYRTAEPETVPGAANMQKVIDKLMLNGESEVCVTPHTHGSQTKLVIDINPKTSPTRLEVSATKKNENGDIIHIASNLSSARKEEVENLQIKES